MNEAGRRALVGLDPNRAPTIVAGLVLLVEAMRAFALDSVEVSEHDILHGGALQLARVASDAVVRPGSPGADRQRSGL